ncbi:MAG TPA: sigma-70 family RNA polymerase sigma factor [Fimbriimonadaceae bacterium]|nr:sigma-70 family RNA polymerase sigma factor [Fimbriimonadaceae bacterium]
MNALRWGCLAEADLVVEAKFGNLAAFDALVRRYRDGAMAQANAILRRRDSAEDAVQDSFLAAYKALPALGDPNSFGAWLGSIVRHRAVRLLAGERRDHVPLDDVILAHTPSIAAEIERERQGCALRAAIEELGPDLGPVLQLYYFDDWPVSSIADFLGLSRTTVKWRLHTGRERLRAALPPDLEETHEPRT